MSTKKILLKRQLDDYVLLQLKVDNKEDTQENRGSAVATLVERCKLLTLKETSPDAGQSDRPIADFLATYAIARLKLQLTRDPDFCDSRRSFDFILGSIGSGKLAVDQLNKAVISMEEKDLGAPLIEAGWLLPSGGQKPWATLILLEPFQLKLADAKRGEIVILQERIGCNVQELNTVKLMLGRRSPSEKERLKQGRIGDRLKNAVRSDSHAQSGLSPASLSGRAIATIPCGSVPALRPRTSLWALDPNPITDPRLFGAESL